MSDRNSVLFRNVLAAALVSPDDATVALELVMEEARGTPFWQLVCDAKAQWYPERSCVDLPRVMDAAVTSFCHSLLKALTSGHPRLII